jgi:hypothetical protein
MSFKSINYAAILCQMVKFRGRFKRPYQNYSLLLKWYYGGSSQLEMSYLNKTSKKPRTQEKITAFRGINDNSEAVTAPRLQSLRGTKVEQLFTEDGASRPQGMLRQ